MSSDHTGNVPDHMHFHSRSRPCYFANGRHNDPAHRRYIRTFEDHRRNYLNIVAPETVVRRTVRTFNDNRAALQNTDLLISLVLLILLLLLLLLPLRSGSSQHHVRMHLLDFRQVGVHKIAEQDLRVQRAPRIRKLDVSHPVNRSFF